MKKEHCNWLCLGEESTLRVSVKVKVNKNKWKKEHCNWLCLGEENRLRVKVKVKVNKNK
jgi:LEA14-like dessication related protein